MPRRAHVAVIARGDRDRYNVKELNEVKISFAGELAEALSTTV